VCVCVGGGGEFHTLETTGLEAENLASVLTGMIQ
jgi:hypothetical protein